VNYDCDIGHFNAIEKIIEILGKIAQGKYSKSEYSLVIQQEQEVQLRVLALESLVQMINALEKLLDELENKGDNKDDSKMSDIQVQDISDQSFNGFDLNSSEIVLNNIIDPERFLFLLFFC